jgi:hypothetical protein
MSAVGFSYEILPQSEATKLKTAAARIRRRVRSAAEDIFQIGQELLEARKLFPSDQSFCAWLQYDLSMPRTSAWRLMSVAKRYFNERSSLEHLPITALYELASPSLPDGLRQELEGRAKGGEVIGADEIKRLRDENAELSDTVVELQAQAEARKIPSVITVAPNHDALEKQYQAFVVHWQALGMDLRERFWREFKTPFAAPFSMSPIQPNTSNSYGSNGSG